MERYSKNKKMLSDEEQDILLSKCIAVIGCGGLGGNVIEMLARIGVKSLKLVDFDCFNSSNLNRQILSNEQNLGKFKVEEAKIRVNMINSGIDVTVYKTEFTNENAKDILSDCDIVLDCLDNIKSRLILEKYASIINIPLIHGAISGWYGQVSTILPNDNNFKKIYGNVDSYTDENGNPSFTPNTIASIQVSECIKVLLNKGEILRNKLLIIDLLFNTTNIIELK